MTIPIHENRYAMVSFTRTIGFRLWLICVAAIMFPLGINIFQLNLQQYKKTLVSTTSDLRENALFKAHTLQQVIPLNVDILALFSEIFDLDRGVPSEPDLVLSKEMEKIFHSTYKEISLVKKDADGNFTVVASSQIQQLGKNYNQEIFLSSYQPFLATLRHSDGTSPVLSVLQTNIFDISSQEVLGILYTLSDTDYLLDGLLASKNPRAIKTAILSKNGIILQATDSTLNLISIYKEVSQEQFCDVFLRKDFCPPHLLLRSPLNLSPLPYGEGFVSFYIGDKEMWGYIHPLQDMDFCILTYEEKTTIFASLWRRALLYFAYFCCVLLGSITAFLVAKRLSKPIRKLATVMIETRRNQHHPYEPDSLGFEINRLGEIFNSMVQSLSQQQSLAEKNYEIKQQAQNALRLGEEAQQRLLPNQLPHYPTAEIAKAYIPAITVGGDFFDSFVIGEGDQAKLFLIVADASGKGVNACAYSLFLKNMLHTFLSELSSIQEAVQQTSSLFYKQTAESGMFVTLCIYCYHYATRQLEYYSCGHNPACLRMPNGEVSFLSHPGMALGFLPEVPPHPAYTLTLEEESLLVLYTDGVTEANNKHGEMFGEERLKTLIASLTKHSAEEAIQSIMLSIKSFVKDYQQHDDITLLVLKITKTDTAH
ncbi:HAMP domain-containing protein [Chlamydia muridarum str. Nigg]|uniref:Regulatory protein n=2 Tax=Chlamydia muridarum TaxID=83560 RepID=A0A0C5X631_CHLMR|nr:SpoIIE family protein phosphatase [Chlamydia muridarum]UFT54370.1 PP2C family protein-serine/threonine phosphatase [Chlamydia trachomatis]AAF39673.1 regulatory protein, putative [Chlamydia muridarum str. Nigg]AID38389.1 regulatory protein [Chlamydia muridarum str. Nigg 2 MCR]AJR10942.1 regulatory protein [Chlamydia muridarum]AVM88597.1 HAMP domain-containing protein [Chlamydia muridarum str. Nigg]